MCARALLSERKPLLVVLPSTPHGSSLPWNYIPAVCYERKIPLYFYQGNDQSKLAQLLHLKQVSVMVLIPKPEESSQTNESSTEDSQFHQAVDSFAQFFSYKVKSPKLVPR